MGGAVAASAGGCAWWCCEEEEGIEEGTADLVMPKGDDIDGRRETAVGSLGERFCGEEGT